MKRAVRPNPGIIALKGAGSVVASAAAPVLARPVLSGSLFLFAAMFGWIAANALYAQSGRHTHPLLTTRPESAVSRPSTAAPSVAALPVPLVRDVQVALIEAGYYSSDADGIPGKATATAIRAYQADHGLPADGEASPGLLAVLQTPEPTSNETVATAAKTERVASLGNGRTADDATSPASTRPAALPAPSRDLVRQVQAGLKGAKIADLDPDGIMGARTEAAIRTFQASQGLDVTGVPNEALLKRLKGLGAPKAR